MMLPCYLHSIDHILLHLHAMKKIFLKLFLICTFMSPNLTKNWTNLAEIFLKFELLPSSYTVE